MMDRIKEALAANDDEWKAIEPRSKAVMDAQRTASTRGGGFGGPGGRTARQPRWPPDAAARRRPGGDPGRARSPPSAVETAAKALQTTLDDKSATPDDIKAKLTALREAKTKAKADLHQGPGRPARTADRPAGSRAGRVSACSSNRPTAIRRVRRIETKRRTRRVVDTHSLVILL